MRSRNFINKDQWLRYSWQNWLQTLLLLMFLGGYLLLLGWLIWGPGAAIWFLVAGGILMLSVRTSSPQLLLKLFNARPLNQLQAAEVYLLVRELSRRAGLPNLPTLYRLPTGQLNAFALGNREAASIAVSDGLLQLLDRRELAAVLAHEISHLRNDDLRVMQLVDLVGRLTNLLSGFGQLLLLFSLPLVLVTDYRVNWFIVAILVFAPHLNALTQLGLARIKEYKADLGAVGLTGDPEGLVNALWKIQRSERGLFQQLLVPGARLPVWLRTHPPTRERIRRLLELTAQSEMYPVIGPTAIMGSRSRSEGSQYSNLWLQKFSPQLMGGPAVVTVRAKQCNGY
ncbi:MAG: M48 family metalloprotease [Deltaproteobacteria bacterium]|nr:M48 family metalloprotease [Deltaproteobacteria bacterium]